MITKRGGLERYEKAMARKHTRSKSKLRRKLLLSPGLGRLGYEGADKVADKFADKGTTFSSAYSLARAHQAQDANYPSGSRSEAKQRKMKPYKRNKPASNKGFWRRLRSGKKIWVRYKKRPNS